MTTRQRGRLVPPGRLQPLHPFYQKIRQRTITMFMQEVVTRSGVLLQSPLGVVSSPIRMVRITNQIQIILLTKIPFYPLGQTF